MTDIPNTYKEFRGWFYQHRASFPADLATKAELAMWAHYTLGSKNLTAAMIAREDATITAFEEAYRVWRG